MAEARSFVINRANEARALLKALPEGPARDALDAFAEVVATRTA
jgi:heptaprenyl diphosphate synthase